MTLKRALAAGLAGLLTLLVPGPQAYAELARAVEAPATSHAAPIVSIPQLPGSVALPSLSSSLGIDGQAAPAAVPSLGATGRVAEAAVSMAATAPQTAASLQSAVAAQPLAKTQANLAPQIQSIAKPSANAETTAAAGENITTILQGGAVTSDVPSVSADLPSQTPTTNTLSRAPPSSRLSPTGKRSIRSLAARYLPAAGSVAAFGLAASAGHAVGFLVSIPVILGSLILHEMGHAWAAYKLGDATAVLQNRLSFKPRDLLTHIDPIMTIVVPIISMLSFGFIAGGARPVPVNSYNFTDRANWKRGMALMAAAGPGVNLALAAGGAAAYAGLAAIGAAPWILGVAVTVVAINAMLAVFNLMPVYPLDGHHIARWLLPSSVSNWLDGVYAKPFPFSWLPMLAFYMVLFKTGIFAMLVGALEGLLLPAIAAAGIVATSLTTNGPAALNPGNPVPVESVQGPASTELVVIFGKKDAIREFQHLSFVDVSAADGVSLYAQTQQRMLVQLRRAGLLDNELAQYDATPVATYDRINAATIRLDAAKAAAFKAALEARGDQVFSNDRRKIIVPVPMDPQDADPTARNPVSMDETLRLTKADSVHKIAQSRWGAPDAGGFKGLLRRLFSEKPVQPKFAVVDSGADTSHPLLKDVKTVNVTSSENKDDIGHGSWVTSMVLNYARWSKNVTHYKTFVGGGASLDDILKALTASANDGNLVISNSWGSDDGDPNSPDSKLVRKLAEEGHVMVFAAGNAGSGANTIGSPAIVTYKDPQTGAIRVVSVAAADRNKKIAYFSSRGPGSPQTKNDPTYPHRPDLTAVGYNTEGAWPEGLGDADRTDPEKGTVKAISGTSMSTPDVAGAIALLSMLFGVTAMGPRLDAVVVAVMSTLEKTGQSRDAEGEGFLNVQAAYDLLAKTLAPEPPAALRRVFGRFADAAMIPSAVVDEYAELRWEREDQIQLLRRTPKLIENPQVQREVNARVWRITEIQRQFPGIEDRFTVTAALARLFAPRRVKR